jgi:hypothetical protein
LVPGILAFGFSAQLPAQASERGWERKAATEVASFLEGYYRGFELLRFDAWAIAAGFRDALRQYRGRRPVMRVADVVVLPRSETTAVATYWMLFSLDGELRNDAVAVAKVPAVNAVRLGASPPGCGSRTRAATSVRHIA